MRNSAIRQKNVIDAAFALGFGSADGYTRAFYREFGCTPKDYAASHAPLTLFIPYGVKFYNLRKEENEVEIVRNVFIQVLEKPCRRVILKRGIEARDYFTYCSEVDCDVWGTLTSMESLCGEPVCLWLPEKYRTPCTSEYVQGVEVGNDYEGPVPDGFDVIELPAAKYLMFQGEPFREEKYCDAIIEIERSAKKYDPSLLGLTWDSQNPRIQLEPIGTRGYIELYPVRPLEA